MEDNDAVPTPGERAEAQQELRELCAGLPSFCRGLDSADWHLSDGAGRWTVAGILEHLTIIEGRVNALIAAQLTGPAEPNWALTAGKEALFSRVATGEQKIEAPSFAQPAYARAPAELMREYERVHPRGLARTRRVHAPLQHQVRSVHMPQRRRNRRGVDPISY
jgi:Mycothiol maleylpyruvate isomerase N-terminal domain